MKSISRKVSKAFGHSWLLLPIALLLAQAARRMPGIVEKYYSNGINRITRSALSVASSAIPCSAAELMILAFMIAIFLYFLAFLACFISNRDKWREALHFFKSLISIAGIIYFLFFFLWGANYYRQPYAEIYGLKLQKSSLQDLRRLCLKLTSEANVLCLNTAQGGQTSQSIMDQVNAAFAAATSTQYELSGTYGKPKAVFFSKALSYAGISGFYFPYTGEANIDSEIPLFMLPCTACHEAAHQRGFAREDEANYIAYRVCTGSGIKYFQYSGTVLALISSMNALYSYDKDGYDDIRKKYAHQLNQDLSILSSFWEKYEGPVDSISTAVNNAYLKANLQKDGILSYGRMVDLLLAQQRSEAGENK